MFMLWFSDLVWEFCHCMITESLFPEWFPLL